jgi:hypothetical protein
MSDSLQFEKLLNKACSEYERITGNKYPVWRRGHHEMVFDLVFDYKISVNNLFEKRWMADCQKVYMGLSNCPVEAVLKCFIDYALHQPDFEQKESVG